VNAYAGIDPIPVHIASSEISLPGSGAKRKRRAMKANTYTLTTAIPYARALPWSEERVEGWITSAVAASSPPVVYIATTQAGAVAQGGGAAQVNGLDTTPFPVNTTDEVWISAASGFPVIVSVVGIYESDG
jgi:hypothetical protein